ncbi:MULTISPECIES: nitrate/nitrite transporter NrtS [unclassified Pseudomonas]|uniref:nitrate/nitrite transporter NrtS n=1 Tax=Pseudomonas TaxID=286 RepID=UPI000B3553E2
MAVFFSIWCKPAILSGAAWVALAVGTVLNLINQSDAIWNNQNISWWNFLLNYAVPFTVSSYSAARHEQKARSKSRL